MTELCSKLSTEYNKHRAFRTELAILYYNAMDIDNDISFTRDDIIFLLKTLKDDYAELFKEELDG